MTWNQQPYGIAACNYCGHTVVTMDPEADLTFCPRCSEKALNRECPHCHEPVRLIANGPQPDHCLSCGGFFSVWGAQNLLAQAPDGTVQPFFVPEPTAQERAAFTKNYPDLNWVDALKAEQQRQQETEQAKEVLN